MQFFTVLVLLVGEFDDQDGVLAGQGNQNQETDLHEDVHRHAGDGHARDRGQQTHRHDQDDRQRQPPA